MDESKENRVGGAVGFNCRTGNYHVFRAKAVIVAAGGALIFSSTAAVYGNPDKIPAHEDTTLAPINPYGTSKLISETIMAELAALNKLDYIALRYFNVAGADPENRIGQKYKAATHLITRALKTAKGEFSTLKIFGTDYETPDGTCIRDYIHVTDLAEAHVLAMNNLLKSKKNAIYNVGYGRGSSVWEVINIAREVTGVDFSVEKAPRREGDPPKLIAGAEKIRKELDWIPKHDSLKFILETAWRWEKSLDVS
ncbi:MAG TPA: UDP-glucose 4-epimerase GalE [Nitrospinota bacterium]|nr:UDP-glucose 4-epimerase GalE [Nitrospinota bacterium]